MARQGDEQRRVGEVLREVVHADLHDGAIVGTEPRRRVGQLLIVELGNVAGDVTPNVGNFVNMQIYAYWSGTQDPSAGFLVSLRNALKHFGVETFDGEI